MKKNVRLLVVWILVNLLSFSPLLAQGTYGYEFKPRRPRVSIPFEWQCNLIVVPIRINGSDTLHFILDTGVGMNLLTDPKVATALALRYVRKIDILGAGEGEPLEAMVAIGNQIYLPGLRANGQSVVALSQDVLALSDYVGMPVQGVFGYDLFKSFVVQLDFSRKIITLHHPQKYRYKKKDGTKIPLSIEGGKPYILAEAEWGDHQKVEVKLLVDTGAGHSLSLDRGTHPGIRLPEKHLQAMLGRGLSGAIHGGVGRLANLRLGGYELPEIITSFPDTLSRAALLNRKTGRQGNLGCEALKRFHVIFNYNEGYMVLKPNKKFFREPFNRDMSGLTLKGGGIHFEKCVVEQVDAGTPADIAGILPGDEIISVNENMTRNIRLGDVYRMFQKKEGKLMKVFLRRKGEFVYTEFLLRKMI
jgi:hypothetical protein